MRSARPGSHLVAMAARLAVVNGSVSCFCIAAFAGCGGTEETERPEADTDAELEPLVDSGSAPADCGADDPYEILLVEDWETGAGTGWYSNNEYCQPCSDLQDVIDVVARPARCLARFPNVETGCVATAVGDDPEAVAGAYQDLRASVREYLPEADPTDEELSQLSEEFRVCSALCVNRECSTVEGEDCEGGDLFAELLPKVAAALAETERLQAELAECRVDCDPTQVPAAMSKPFPGERIPGGRCGSTTGAHVRLNRLVHREGTLGRQFSPTEPFDASEYEGVSFWARNVPGARSTFRVAIPEISTDEKYVNEDGESPCQFINPKELTDEACDKFGRFYSTTSDWQFFAIPFSEMRQAGFGKQAEFFDIANLMGIAFEYKQGRWDYWVDDVGFYRRK